MKHEHYHPSPFLWSPIHTVAWALLSVLPLISGIASARTSPSESSIGTPAANVNEAGTSLADVANSPTQCQVLKIYVTTPRAGQRELGPVAVSRSRQLLLASQTTGEEDFKVVARNLKDGTPLFEMNWRPMRGKSMAISDDDSLMACCDRDLRQLIVCDVTTQRVVCTCPLPNQESPQERAELEFSPDGRNVLLVHLPRPCFRTRDNGTIVTLVSLPDGKVKDTQTLFQCSRLLSRVANSNSYLLAGRCGTRQVDIKSGRIVIHRQLTLVEQTRMLHDRHSMDSRNDKILTLPSGEMLHIAIAPDGSQMAYVQADYQIIDAVGKSRHVGNTLRIWDFSTGQVIAEVPFGSESNLDQSKCELHFFPVDSPELDIMKRSVQEHLLPRLGVSRPPNANQSP